MDTTPSPSISGVCLNRIPLPIFPAPGSRVRVPVNGGGYLVTWAMSEAMGNGQQCAPKQKKHMDTMDAKTKELNEKRMFIKRQMDEVLAKMAEAKKWVRMAESLAATKRVFQDPKLYCEKKSALESLRLKHQQLCTEMMGLKGELNSRGKDFYSTFYEISKLTLDKTTFECIHNKAKSQKLSKSI